MNSPIISSQKKSLKFFNLVCIALGILSVVVFCVVVDVINNGYFSKHDMNYNIEYILGVPCRNFLLPILCFMAIVNLIFYISNFSITVYDNKIIGQGLFKKQVSLPMDSVTAASICMFHGIAISTSSGLIKFYMIKNNIEVYEAINKIIEDRQQKPTNVVQQIVNQTSAVELKEYKELLDAGVITQEEFDAKKKQLLGL